MANNAFLLFQIVQNVSVLGMAAFLIARVPAVRGAWVDPPGELSQDLDTQVSTVGGARSGARRDLPRKIALGVLFGILSAAGNWLNLASKYGLLTNARQIMAEVGGLLGGPLTGLLAGVLGALPSVLDALPRLFGNGSGIWAVVIANMVMGVIGGLFARKFRCHKMDLQLAALIGFLGECVLTALTLGFSQPSAAAWRPKEEIALALPAVLLHGLALLFIVYVLRDVIGKQGEMPSREQQLLASQAAGGPVRDGQSEVEEKQLLLLQTEYRMLRAQVDPHFFFNTLSTIQALISTDPDKSITLIKNLASFFRKTLNPEREVVTLKEELETVRNYIRIEKVRFGDRINLVEALPSELLGREIPVFSLQILVENAVRHGLSLKKGNGTVQISGWLDESSWYLNVEDDGVGMSEEQLEKVRQGEAVPAERESGIGLFNVRKRIQTIYGSDFGLKIQSQWHKGTSVTVRFPLHTGEFSAIRIREADGKEGSHEKT